MPSPVLAAALIVSAFTTALAALAAMSLIDRSRSGRLRWLADREDRSITFLFDDTTLIDATRNARHLFEAAPRRGTAWDHLIALLRPRFPSMADALGDLETLGRLELTSVDGTARLEAFWKDGFTRISLIDDTDDALPAGLDRHGLLAMRHELEILRATANLTPFPIWRELTDGSITWANRAYLDLAEQNLPDDVPRPWPPDRIFDVAPDDTADIQRLAITPAGQTGRHWFDLHRAPLEDGALFSAVPVDDLVHAETAMQDFVATLSKTFASLPIGLAIFDRNRELAIFNPALTDLTTLSADFLCARPSLAIFLDRLRQLQMLPEPRDYKSWRQQVQDLVTAARDGTFEENWVLPSGQTFRVTGQPHPDGALAFLVEDISTEMSLTRRFRSELEAGQATLDALPDAIAIFGADNNLQLCNRAYDTLWGHPGLGGLGAPGLPGALTSWQSAFAPGPALSDLCKTLANGTPRDVWSAELRLLDGRRCPCRITPMAQGATMVTFAPDVPVPANSKPAIRSGRKATKG